MGDERITVISDAGPLIHLNEIDCLSFLSLFEELHIPHAVWLETVGKGYLQAKDVLDLGHVQRHFLSQSDMIQFLANHQLKDIHTGERECLYLCQQLHISTLLTDDLAVRKAAKLLNLKPVGSLGIIAKAYFQGFISITVAENYMFNLYNKSSLFVTKAIVELAVEKLHQSN